VDDTCCAALGKNKEILRKGGEMHQKEDNLFDGVRDLCLVANVARIKWSVVIALNDIKDGHWVTARDESFYDVPAEETAATDDEESVALRGGHEKTKGTRQVN